MRSFEKPRRGAIRACHLTWPGAELSFQEISFCLQIRVAKRRCVVYNVYTLFRFPLLDPAMSKLTRLLIVVACALIAALPMPVLAQKKPHIIVVTHGQVSDSFWVVVKNGVQLATEETGANVEYRAPEV